MNSVVQSQCQAAHEHVQAGRMKEAKALLTAVCNAGSVDAEIWTLLGEVNVELSLYTEAAECLYRALELAPSHVNAHLHLGHTLCAQSRPEAALPHFHMVLSNAPETPGAIESFQRASLQVAAEKGDTFAVRLRGAVELIVPGSLQLMTPYVLLEQEDWFEDEISFVRNLLQPGARVVDIGASYGVYTAAMAHAIGPAGRLWAFEPASTTASFLRRSLAHNQFSQVELVQAALADRRGVAEMSLNMNSELNALTQYSLAAGPVERVSLLTLDECAHDFGWEDIEFIKLDAEGGEENILRGGSSLLERESPLVMFELKHGKTVNRALLGQFNSLGYTPYRLVPGIGLLAPFDVRCEVDDYQLNLFACKPDRAAVLEARGLLASSPGMDQLPSCGDILKLRADAFDRSLPPSLRLAHLTQAAFEAERDTAVPSASRLHRAARIAWELGERKKAVNWLVQLCNDPMMSSAPIR